MIQYSKLEDKISTVDTFLSAVNQQTLRKKLHEALVAVNSSVDADDWFNLFKTLCEVGDTLFTRESRDYEYIINFIENIQNAVHDEYEYLSNHVDDYDYDYSDWDDMVTNDW